MKLTILGSGGALGVPVWSCKCQVCTQEIKSDKRNIRTRPSLLIESKNKKIVIDIGNDFRNQMLRERIKRIDYLLLTHSHMDHTASLAELRAGGNVHLEAPQGVYDKIKKIGIAFIYLRKRNPKINIDIFKPKKVGNVFIEAVEVQHKKDFSTVKDDPTFGFLLTEKNKTVAYIPDLGKIIKKDKLESLDVLICDGAGFKSKRGHEGIEGGIKLYKELKPKLMIFTHLGHYMSHKELEKYVGKFGNIKLAYDGMKIII